MILILIALFLCLVAYFVASHLGQKVITGYFQSLPIEKKRTRLIAAESSLRIAADKATYGGDEHFMKAANRYKKALMMVIQHDQRCDDATAAEAAEWASRPTMLEIDKRFNERVVEGERAEEKAIENEFFRVRSIASECGNLTNTDHLEIERYKYADCQEAIALHHRILAEVYVETTGAVDSQRKAYIEAFNSWLELTCCK